LVEKKIGFNETEFKLRNREIFGATSQIYNNLILNNQDVRNLKSSKEYNELTDFFKNSFIWKVGKYSAKIEVFIKGVKESFDHQLQFQLTGLDIKTLESNIKNCIDITENHFIIANPNFKITWRWVYPIKI
jgi:ribosomal protein L6P/L9E